LLSLLEAPMSAGRRLRRTRRRRRDASTLSIDMLRDRALLMVGLGPNGKTTLSLDVSKLDAPSREQRYREWRQSTGDYELVAAHENIVGTEPGCAVCRFFFADGTEIIWTVDDGPTPGTLKSSWRVLRSGPRVARAVAHLRAEHRRRGAVPMDGRWARGGSA
jgi:hypothetical protein